MKKNAKDKVQQKGKKPFFAHLLEEQELEQVSGGTIETKKYPSDNEEYDPGPIVTLKFPSDQEDSP